MSLPNLLIPQLPQIQAVLPEDIATTHLHDNGDDFLVVEVNQAWMFRFARTPDSHKVLQCEKRFLPEFEKISPIPIPHICYSGDNFIGYPKICGSLLTPETLNRLDASTHERFARQIGDFLSTLHAFPLERALSLGLTEGWDGWRLKAYHRFKERVAPQLSNQARINTITFMDQFFAMSWNRGVIHGDFYPMDHVFFDEEKLEICGVIDFGDLTIDDPLSDLRPLYVDYGQIFLDEVLKYYSLPIDTDYIERIKILNQVRPLFDAPYALEFGFMERFQRRIQEIERDYGSR